MADKKKRDSKDTHPKDEGHDKSKDTHKKPAHSISKHSSPGGLKQRIQQGNLSPSAYIDEKTLINATVENAQNQSIMQL